MSRINHWRKKTAMMLAFAFLLSNFGFFASNAKAEKKATAWIDQLNLTLHSLRMENIKDEVVYKVVLTAEAPYIEPMFPPQLISFVLDGTASMVATDGTPESRDVRVRKAVVAALDVLMSEKNPNKKSTFVDVILFGGNTGQAQTLTGWASQGAPLRAQLENGATTYLGVFNKNHYVPLLEPGTDDRLNHVLANLFYCTNTAPITTLTAAPFGSIADPDYSISNQFFYGNDQQGGSADKQNRFPMNSYATFIGPGLRMAYENLALKQAEIDASADYTKKEKENAARYIMLLTDGVENQQGKAIPITQTWAALIKAPTDMTLNEFHVAAPAWATSSSTPAIATPINTTGPRSGLDAKIWVMLIGTEVPAAAGYMDNWPQAAAAYTSLGLTGGSMTAQVTRSMIGIAQAGIDRAGWAMLAGLDPTISGTTVPPNAWDNFYRLLYPIPNGSPQLKQQFLAETHYLQTINSANVITFFSAFAAEAIHAEGVTNVQAFGNFTQFFSLYGGKDKKYKPYTYSSIAGKKPEPTIDITPNGKMKWEIGPVASGEKVTLVYYVRLEPEYVGTDSYYELLEGMTVYYDGSLDTGYHFAFPGNFSPAGSIENQEDTNKGFNPIEPEENTTQGQILILPNNFINLGSAALEAPLQVYQSQEEKIQVSANKTTIYQKTTSGKYKAVAVVKNGRSFRLYKEEKNYYKIYFVKKGKTNFSVGYIKKSDAEKM